MSVAMMAIGMQRLECKGQPPLDMNLLSNNSSSPMSDDSNGNVLHLHSLNLYAAKTGDKDENSDAEGREYDLADGIDQLTLLSDDDENKELEEYGAGGTKRSKSKSLEGQEDPETTAPKRRNQSAIHEPRPPPTSHSMKYRELQPFNSSSNNAARRRAAHNGETPHIECNEPGRNEVLCDMYQNLMTTSMTLSTPLPCFRDSFQRSLNQENAQLGFKPSTHKTPPSTMGYSPSKNGELCSDVDPDGAAICSEKDHWQIQRIENDLKDYSYKLGLGAAQRSEEKAEELPLTLGYNNSVMHDQLGISGPPTDMSRQNHLSFTAAQSSATIDSLTCATSESSMYVTGPPMDASPAGPPVHVRLSGPPLMTQVHPSQNTIRPAQNILGSAHNILGPAQNTVGQAQNTVQPFFPCPDIMPTTALSSVTVSDNEQQGMECTVASSPRCAGSNHELLYGPHQTTMVRPSNTSVVMPASESFTGSRSRSSSNTSISSEMASQPSLPPNRPHSPKPQKIQLARALSGGSVTCVNKSPGISFSLSEQSALSFSLSPSDNVSNISDTVKHRKSLQTDSPVGKSGVSSPPRYQALSSPPFCVPRNSSLGYNTSASANRRQSQHADLPAGCEVQASRKMRNPQIMLSHVSPEGYLLPLTPVSPQSETESARSSSSSPGHELSNSPQRNSESYFHSPQNSALGSVSGACRSPPAEFLPHRCSSSRSQSIHSNSAGFNSVVFEAQHLPGQHSPSYAAQISIQPAQISTQPAQISTQSAQISTQSAQMSAQPAQISAQPAQISTQSAQMSAQPAQISTQPAQISTQSAQMSAQPAQMSAQPAQISAQPAQMSAQPAQMSAQPTQISAQPAQMSAQPAQMSAQPAQMSAQPAQMSAQPAHMSTVQIPTSTMECPGQNWSRNSSFLQPVPDNFLSSQEDRPTYPKPVFLGRVTEIEEGMVVMPAAEGLLESSLVTQEVLDGVCDADGVWLTDSEGDTFLHSLSGWVDQAAAANILYQLKDRPNFLHALNQYNSSSETPLYSAVCLGKRDLVEAMLRCRVDVNRFCCFEAQAHTPLHKAVEKGDADMVSVLLTSPYIDVDAERFSDRCTPLMLALMKHVPCHPMEDCLDIIKMFIDEEDCPNFNAVDQRSGKTAFMLAVETKDVRVVDLILREVGAVGARQLVNVRNRAGNSAVHLAAGLGEVSVEVKRNLLRMLIMSGGDTAKENHEKESPSHWAGKLIREIQSELT